MPLTYLERSPTGISVTWLLSVIRKGSSPLPFELYFSDLTPQMRCQKPTVLLKQFRRVSALSAYHHDRAIGKDRGVSAALNGRSPRHAWYRPCRILQARIHKFSAGFSKSRCPAQAAGMFAEMSWTSPCHTPDARRTSCHDPPALTNKLPVEPARSTVRVHVEEQRHIVVHRIGKVCHPPRQAPCRNH